MTRLIEGNPIHTTPELLKENLYKEAKVSRATMNRSKDILARWDQAVRQQLDGSSTGPVFVCVQHAQQIAELSMALSAARQQLSEAKESIRASATVIAVLHAENTHLQQTLTAREKAKVTGLRSHGTPGLQ